MSKVTWRPKEVMSNDELLAIDSTVENSLSKILPHQAILSSYGKGWNEINIEHHSQPTHETPEHFHTQHILVVITQCDQLKVERKVDGKFHCSHMTCGEAFLLPAQVHHRVWIYGEAEYAFLSLKPGLMTRIAEESTSRECIELVPQHQISDSLIHSLGLALLSELASNEMRNRLYIESAANLLAVHLLQRYSTQKPTTWKHNKGLPKTKLQQIIEYINEHLTDDLSLQAMANQIGMSKYHFSRLFKQSTGLTPWQYVSQRRLEIAKQLLAKQELSIAEISDRLGFTNQQQLTTFFRKHMGIAPFVYRQSL
jgi:AraC family transcriptional regulator